MCPRSATTTTLSTVKGWTQHCPQASLWKDVLGQCPHTSPRTQNTDEAFLKIQHDCYFTHCEHKQKLKPKWARLYWRWCSQHHRGSKKSIVNSVVKKAGTVQHRARNRKQSKHAGEPQSHWAYFNPVPISISAQEIKQLCLLLQEATSIPPEQRQTFGEGNIPATAPQKHLSPLHLL